MDKKYLTWDEITLLTKHLIAAVEATDFRPDIIMGISRGGLVPAIMLSHRWDLPMVPLRWSTRDHLYTDADTIQAIVTEVEEGKKLLIVDDICDSGITLHQLHDHFEQMLPRMRDNIKYATLHERAGAKFAPHFVGGYIIDNTWMVYPYEEF